MNTNGLAKHYEHLTPEERIPLILQALARSDELEAERLISSAPRVLLETSNHFRLADTFFELSVAMFIEVLDEAAAYQEAQTRLDALDDFPDDFPPKRRRKNGSEEVSFRESVEQLALVQGFFLKVKVESWKLFCERRQLPPFHVWEELPGFERFKRAVEMAETLAYRPEGMLKWMNRVRPEGAPEVVTLTLTPENGAAQLESFFKTRTAS